LIIATINPGGPHGTRGRRTAPSVTTEQGKRVRNVESATNGLKKSRGTTFAFPSHAEKPTIWTLCTLSERHPNQFRIKDIDRDISKEIDVDGLQSGSTRLIGQCNRQSTIFGDHAILQTNPILANRTAARTCHDVYNYQETPGPLDYILNPLTYHDCPGFGIEHQIGNRRVKQRDPVFAFSIVRSGTGDRILRHLPLDGR
jgi:hypothetical protein